MPLALDGESTKYPRKFSELGIEFTNQDCANDDEVIAFAKNADALITVGSLRPMPRSVIENLEQCRLISNTQIGYDSIDIEAATERGILVTNVPDYCVEEVSDHAFALMLALNHRLPQSQDMTNKGEWNAADIGFFRRLKGQVLGIIGLGRIGKTLAHKAKCFGLQVKAFDLYVPES